MGEREQAEFIAAVRDVLITRRADGFQQPILPTAETDPQAYNGWVYGIDEIASNLDLDARKVEETIVAAATESGYRHPEDVLYVERKHLYADPDRVRQAILTENFRLNT